MSARSYGRKGGGPLLSMGAKDVWRSTCLAAFAVVLGLTVVARPETVQAKFVSATRGEGLLIHYGRFLQPREKVLEGISDRRRMESRADSSSSGSSSNGSDSSSSVSSSNIIDRSSSDSSSNGNSSGSSFAASTAANPSGPVSPAISSFSSSPSSSTSSPTDSSSVASSSSSYPRAVAPIPPPFVASSVYVTPPPFFSLLKQAMPSDIIVLTDEASQSFYGGNEQRRHGNLEAAAEETCEGVDVFSHTNIEQLLGVEYEEALDSGGASVVATVEGWRNSSDVLSNLETFFTDIYHSVQGEVAAGASSYGGGGGGASANSTGVVNGTIVITGNEGEEEGNKTRTVNSIGLSEGGMDYVESLLPFLTPAFVGILVLLVAVPLAAFTCSAKCRRCISCACCLVVCCGSRRKEARRFSTCNRILGSIGSIVLALALTAIILLGIFWSDKLNAGLNTSQCALTAVVRDVVNGVPSAASSKTKGFVGVLPALQMMQEVSRDLDPISEAGVIAKVEDLIQQALNVTAPKVDLLNSLGHLITVIDDVHNNPDRGPVESTHHMFIFNVLISKFLMLPKFFEQLRETIDETLEEMSSQANHYLDLAKEEISGVADKVNVINYGDTRSQVDGYVDTYLKINNGIDDSKDIRYWVLMALYILLLIVAIFSSIYLIYLFCCASSASSIRPPSSSVFSAYQRRQDDSRHPQQSQPPGLFGSPLSSWPSPKPAICCCCANLVCCIIAFLVGGILLTIAVVQTDVCRYSREELLTSDGLDRTLKAFGVANDKALKAAKACLVKGADSDLGVALNLKESFDQVPKVREYLGDIEKQLPMPFNVSFVDELVFAAKDYGWVFLLNHTDAREHGNGDRLDTYKEVLRSGIQDKGRYLAGNYAKILQTFFMIGDADDDGGGDAPIYGLLDIEEKLSPFYFEALHASGKPSDPDHLYMITSDFDPESELVIAEARNRTLGDEEYRKYLNAVWWAVAKQKLRSTSDPPFRCPGLTPSFPLSPTSSEHTEGISAVGACDYNAFTEFVSDSVAENVRQASKKFAFVVEDGKQELLSYVNNTAESMLSKVDDIRDNLNCGPMASGTQKLVNAWCQDVTQHAVLVSLIWVLIGILSLVGFITMYMVWRVIEHNRYYDKIASDYGRYGFDGPPTYNHYT